MKKEEVDLLIEQFLKGELSEKETLALEMILESTKNRASAEELIEIDAILSSEPKEELNTSEVYKNLEKELDSQKVKTLPFRNILKYAAIFVGVLGLGYYSSQNFFTSNPEILPDAYKNSITLQLENGNIEVISESGEKKVIDKNGKVVGTQSGDKLLYEVDEELDKLVYNELNIPNGKTFQLQLSDGSKIYLNAGSSLKYPINFIKGQERRVFLNGEAFFKVAKDKAHPFIVTSDKLDIRVLGTQFNVNTYNADNDVNTVLVEGSVALYNEGDVYDANTAILLEPGQMAKWNKEDSRIGIEKVDTSEYTAWINGKLLFKRRDFSEISQVLERHFDIVIENNYDFLNSQRFLATFESESIEQILEYFKRTTDFNYELNDNKVTIYKPKPTN